MFNVKQFFSNRAEIIKDMMEVKGISYEEAVSQYPEVVHTYMQATYDLQGLLAMYLFTFWMFVGLLWITTMGKTMYKIKLWLTIVLGVSTLALLGYHLMTSFYKYSILYRYPHQGI